MKRKAQVLVKIVTFAAVACLCAGASMVYTNEAIGEGWGLMLMETHPYGPLWTLGIVVAYIGAVMGLIMPLVPMALVMRPYFKSA